MYQDGGDRLKKTAQSGLAKEFRVLQSTADANWFVGITNDAHNEVYQIGSTDDDRMANPYLCFDRVIL